jgi:hypothetical protein
MTLDFLNLLKSRGSSLMGLTLEGRRLEGVVLRRAKGGLGVERSFEMTLSLDPLTNDPKLVGQEIRNRLDEAGVHTSRCAVGVPLNWAMILQTKLPEIPEEDVASFLGIQAEKGFPYGLEDLSISTSRYRSSKAEQYAMQVAIPKNYLARLEEVLIAARLKPVHFSLVIAALQPPRSDGSEGILALAAGENNVDLQVTCGGGVVVLRALQGAIEMDGARRQIDADLLTREIRLTLGQMPKELSQTITKIRVFGRSEWRQPLADAIAACAKRLGLQVEVRSVLQADGVGARVPGQENAPPALVMAARCINGEASDFEFLPPKVSKWAELTSRFSSRRILWAGASAAAAIVLTGGAFLVQYVRLSVYESRWRAIEPRVTEIKGVQENIRKFRPWSVDSRYGLAILRKLTEVFPEDGAVTAKMIAIKDLSEVSCSGIAQDNQAWLKMRDRLQAANHVGNVQLQSMIGSKPPMRFTFNFRWTEGGNREN